MNDHIICCPNTLGLLFYITGASAIDCDNEAKCMTFRYPNGSKFTAKFGSIVEKGKFGTLYVNMEKVRDLECK